MRVLKFLFKETNPNKRATRNKLPTIVLFLLFRFIYTLCLGQLHLPYSNVVLAGKLYYARLSLDLLCSIVHVDLTL